MVGEAVFFLKASQTGTISRPEDSTVPWPGPSAMQFQKKSPHCASMESVSSTGAVHVSPPSALRR